MILKGGAVLKEDRGRVVARTQAVDLYSPKTEPEIRIPIKIDEDTPILVCVLSRSDGKGGGWWAAYGTGSVERKYRGENYHTRCAAFEVGYAVNHYLEVRSFGMDGRRDLIRRVTISVL